MNTDLKSFYGGVQFCDCDYAHCNDCDKVINLDKETYMVYEDETYCELCMDKELI